MERAERGGTQIERSQITFFARFDRSIGRQQRESARFLGAGTSVSAVFEDETERAAVVSPAADDEAAGVGMIA